MKNRQQKFIKSAPALQETARETESPGFAKKLLAAVSRTPDPQNKTGNVSLTTEIEPLAGFAYEKELELKNRIFKEFWKENQLPGKPEEIIASPRPRHYRTTTKRRVIKQKNKFYLSFSEEIRPPLKNIFTASELEPEEHSMLYEYLINRINEPVYSIIGHNLNYLIIRGSYSEFSVIFNVHTLSGAIVNKLKALSSEIKAAGINIISSFIYLDPTKSDYYLESFRPEAQVNFKKLFGPDKLFVKFHERKYSFYPTSFSQVNESMVPVMLEMAMEMLLPAHEARHSAGSIRFIDLYCGYGLFAHHLADNFTETIAVEAEGSSIKSAIENSTYMAHKAKVRFLAKRITEESLESILPELSDIPEIYLLDPPRQGTEKGVIKAVAHREPEKVMHIFCNVDRISFETAEWERYGYKIEKAVPLDMFPGTPNLEVLVLLTPVQI